MNKMNEELNHYNLIKADAIDSFKQGDFEKALDYTYVAALIPWQHHLGFWHDEELEHLLSGIGMSLKGDFTSKKSKGRKKKVAYVGTNIMIKKGLCAGHCGVLKQWAELLEFKPEEQILYMTNCHPFKSGSKINKIGKIPVYNLSWQDSYLKRIKELVNRLNNDSPDYIFLFIDANDVIAITALNALQNRPKVFFFNHGDHLFWLGKSAADHFIEFREEGAQYSKKYRNINEIYMVPLTTSIKPKKISLKEWKIKSNATISLSVGRFDKVLADDQAYFKIIEELLDKFPDHYHIFITDPPSPDVMKSYLKNENLKERFIVKGPYLDLSPFYGAADFLIETVPESGSMVRVEAMACKLPIVAYYNKKFSLASAKDHLPSRYPFIASTNDEIINYSSKLVNNPKLRKNLGEDLYNYYSQELTLEKIQKDLKGILNNDQNMLKTKNTTLDGCDYDVEYVRSIHGAGKCNFYSKLILQSNLKESNFSLMENAGFYLNALKNGEFNFKQKLIYALLMFIGFRGVSTYKKLLN